MMIATYYNVFLLEHSCDCMVFVLEKEMFLMEVRFIL